MVMSSVVCDFKIIDVNPRKKQNKKLGQNSRERAQLFFSLSHTN